VPDLSQNGKLRARIRGLSQIEKHLGESLPEIIDKYRGVNFRDSQVEKSKFFAECLHLDLSGQSEELIKDRCKLSFHKDVRSSIEYGLDLVFGWLSEDLMLAKIASLGIEVELGGQDRFREFLSAAEIGTESDFRLTKNASSRFLEIVFSWNGYWEMSDQWDLRDSKFKNLRQSDSLCLGIELPSQKGFMLDMKEVCNEFIERENPAWGNKNAFTLTKMRKRLTNIPDALHTLESFFR
jgi:hypothetical protein